MEAVLSKDGTRIAYQRSGTGQPLVLVHGTAGTASRWGAILPGLERQYTVYAVERRGRGESGDAPGYAVEREFEDVAAVVDTAAVASDAGDAGEIVHVLGHSFGGLCAMEAALLTPNVSRLILYEPALPGVGKTLVLEDVIRHLESLLDSGDREGVLTFFLEHAVRMPPHELERFKSTPVWPARVKAAHTLPRELRATEDYVFEPERLGRLRVPVLLLLGGDSPALFRANVERLHAALPNSRIVVMPGQQHIAMDTAPDLFVREVVAFLAETP